MPVHNEPFLETRATQFIIHTINRVGNSWIERLKRAGSSIWERTWKREVKEIVYECKQMRFYLSTLPSYILSDIIPESITTYLILIENYNKEHKIPPVELEKRWDDHCYVCKCILRVVMFPCFDVYDLTGCRHNFLPVLAVQSIHMLPNIKTLLLPVTSSLMFSETLARRLCVLTMLQEFSYNFDCSNYILEQLSRFCTQLKILNIKNSWSVNDNAVHHLLHLKDLTFLDIRGTSIKLDSYRSILMQLPKLNNITWNDSVDKILRALYPQCLKKINIADVVITRLQILVEKCSNLVELKIMSNQAGINLAGLAEMAHLKVLRMQGFNFVENNMNRMFQLIGQNLKVLELKSINSLSIEAIISTCSNLKEFVLLHCEFEISAPNLVLDTTLPHFRNVELMSLSGLRNAKTFYNRLRYYENLKKFHIGIVYDEIDDCIKSTVENGFRNVTEIYIEKCHINFHTVSLIITHCPNLRLLGYTELWLHWTQTNIDEIKNFIRINNYALTLIA